MKQHKELIIGGEEKKEKEKSSEELFEKYDEMRTKANFLLSSLYNDGGLGLSEIKELLKGEGISHPDIQNISFEKLNKMLQEEKFDEALENASKIDFLDLQNKKTELNNLRSQIKSFEKDRSDIYKVWKKQKQYKQSLLKSALNIRKLQKIQAELERSFEEKLAAIVKKGKTPSLLEETKNKMEQTSQLIERQINKIREKDSQITYLEALLEIRDIKLSLQKYKFYETKTFKELLEAKQEAEFSDKPLVVWGETGSGKTEGLKYYYRAYKNKEPIVMPSGKEITQYDVFGAKGIKEFEDANVSKAALEGRPCIFDEFDLIPHEILGELHPVLDAISKKEPIPIPGMPEPIPYKEGFEITFTGNRKSERYNKREEIDTAFGRRISHYVLKYPPLSDLKKMAYAETLNLVDNSQPDKPVLDKINNFLETTHLIQRVFSGEKNFFGYNSDPTTNKPSLLEIATVTPADILTVIRSWKKDFYQGELEKHIYNLYLKSVHAAPNDKILLFQLFAVKEFFKDWPYEKINIPGLTEEDWKRWIKGKL